MKNWIVLIILCYSAYGFSEDKIYTTYRDGKQIDESTTAPPLSPDDFYVKSLGIRIQAKPNEKQKPFDAIKFACEDKKSGIACFYFASYYEEQKQKDLAQKYFKLSCEYGFADACKK